MVCSFQCANSSLLFYFIFFYVVVGIEPRALGTNDLTPNSSFVKLSAIFYSFRCYCTWNCFLNSILGLNIASVMNYDGFLYRCPEISCVFF